MYYFNCNQQPDGEATPCPTLRLGNRGPSVAFVQNLLRQRGYNILVDGIYGYGTRGAVLQFQRRNSLSATGQVDSATWRALGVTCMVGSYHPPATPETPPAQTPQTLPSFPDKPAVVEPSLDGLNYTWEEIGSFRYILTTNKARYAQGEDVVITFRKRNITEEPIVLHYPSDELFDFYISNSQGQELYRLSDNIVDTGIPHDLVMAPNQAESSTYVWNQVTNHGQLTTPQQLTLWGVNNAIGVSIPLPFVIY